MDKFLIVGLGNPGDSYQETRHNIGFKVLDFLAEQLNVSFLDEKYGLVASGKYKGRTIYLLKPTTFMNLSGKAVAHHLINKKIKMSNFLVVADDLHLSFGMLKARRKGSDGGHNGHKDIIHKLQTNKYPRLKFGIGNNFSIGKQSNYVLSKWSKDEEEQIHDLISKSSNEIITFCIMGIETMMRELNSYNKN